MAMKFSRTSGTGGVQGAVYPINPKADTILDLTCFPSVAETPEPADLAVIIIPARMVPQAVHDCGERGVRSAVIITGGFSEAGAEGAALQQQTAEAARKYGLRLLGPNCQGVNNPYHRLCASWPLLTYRGIVAVVSQSGTVGAAMMDWFSEEKLGVSSFVALGNRVDMDESDLIAYFNADKNTAAIAAYIEGIKRPEKFMEAVERLHKPLVVLKPGRTPKGKVAAESHTKSLAGADAIYEALFAKYDICRAHTHFPRGARWQHNSPRTRPTCRLWHHRPACRETYRDRLCDRSGRGHDTDSSPLAGATHAHRTEIPGGCFD
jgi:acetyltransferase